MGFARYSVRPAIPRWNAWEWNASLFPDPKSFADWAHGQGLSLVANVHPTIDTNDPRYPAVAAQTGGVIGPQVFSRLINTGSYDQVFLALGLGAVMMILGGIIGAALAVPITAVAWEIVKVWDDPSVDWAVFDRVVIRSAWDYTARVDAFLDKLDALVKAEHAKLWINHDAAQNATIVHAPKFIE